MNACFGQSNQLTAPYSPQKFRRWKFHMVLVLEQLYYDCWCMNNHRDLREAMNFIHYYYTRCTNIHIHATAYSGSHLVKLLYLCSATSYFLNWYNCYFCLQCIEEPKVIVTRFEYANLFHTVTDWYSAYVSSRVTGLPNRPNLVFVDGHCKVCTSLSLSLCGSSLKMTLLGKK